MRDRVFHAGRQVPIEGLRPGVGNEIIPHAYKTQWTGCKVRAAVAPVRKIEQAVDRFQNIFPQSAGGWRVVASSVFPDVSYVLRGFRVKFESPARAHSGGRFRQIEPLFVEYQPDAPLLHCEGTK